MDLVQSLHHNFDHNFYHKFDHNSGLGVQGKLSRRAWHYSRVDLGSTIQGWPLSKGGSGVHYPRVATIQSQKNEPVWPRVHYPRVATIEGVNLGSPELSKTCGNISKIPSEGIIESRGLA